MSLLGIPVKSTLLPLHLRLNNQSPFLILRVFKEIVMVDLHKSLLVAIPQTKLHIMTFLLCQRCHNMKQYLPFKSHDTDILFFKKHGDIPVFQLLNVFQTVQCIPHKTAVRPDHDHIDFPAMHFSIMRLNSPHLRVSVLERASATNIPTNSHSGSFIINFV